MGEVHGALRNSDRLSLALLTVLACLFTDGLAPLSLSIPIEKKPLNLNAVSCPWSQVSEDLRVILRCDLNL